MTKHQKINVTRRNMFKTLAAVTSVTRALPSVPSPKTTNALPNILLLLSDDHTSSDLGCYGAQVIHTPNLDAFAAQGVRFENAFVTAPECSPNRSSILSGCVPHTINTARLHAPYPAWEPSIVETLRKRGYYTGAYGKVHQGASFDRRFDFRASEDAPFEEFFNRRPKSKPFFLHVGFLEPHRPYRKGMFSPPHNPENIHVPAFLPDLPAVREDLALYYDAISRMDARCGEIFNIVEKEGLTGDTFVVFTGDNGMPFPGAKGRLYDPGLRVPLLMRWPNKIRPESVVKQLVSSIDLTSTWLDVAGVAVLPRKLQGKSLLPVLEGKAVREAIFAERNWHDVFDPMRCVRTERYKLIFNARPEVPYRPMFDIERSPTWQACLDAGKRGVLPPHHWRLLEPTRPMLEFYDLQRDPWEFHNRASDPDLAHARRDLEYMLSDWMHETQDFLAPLWSKYPAAEGPGRRNWL